MIVTGTICCAGFANGALMVTLALYDPAVRTGLLLTDTVTFCTPGPAITVMRPVVVNVKFGIELSLVITEITCFAGGVPPCWKRNGCKLVTDTVVGTMVNRIFALAV